MRHATPDQIVAFRDGEQLEAEADQHIRSCPLCRRQLGEARWLRTHTLSQVLRPVGPEPSRDEIAAYLDEALDESEMERVETHIRANDRCLAVFDQLLMMNLKLKDPLPSPAYVESLKAKLREPKLLGKLRVFVTDRFKQVFHPARVGEPAHRRAMKLIQEPDAPLPCMEHADLACIEIDEAVLCENRAAGPPPSLAPSNPRVIDTGRWLIRAVTSGSADQPILELEIEETGSGKPVPGVKLMFEPSWDDPIHDRTDEKGMARFPLTDGDGFLDIGDGPDLVLEISADLDPQ